MKRRPLTALQRETERTRRITPQERARGIDESINPFTNEAKRNFVPGAIVLPWYGPLGQAIADAIVGCDPDPRVHQLWRRVRLGERWS